MYPLGCANPLGSVYNSKLYNSENSLNLPCSPGASVPAGLGICSHSRVMLQPGAFSLLQQNFLKFDKKLEEGLQNTLP